MTLTRTTLDPILKELYDGQAVEDLVYDLKARPFLSMLKKTRISGRKYPLPVVFEDVAGRSATFSSAQSDIASSELEQFEITTKKNYSLARIDTEGLRAASNDKGAFLNGLKHMVDSAVRSLSNNLESDLFRDGSGQIGTIGSGSGGTTITLSNSEDIVNFRKNQKLVTAEDNTSALSSAAARTIQSVDREAGSFVIDVAFGGTAADGDAIFTSGDYASASDRNKISGLDAWLPATVTATSFFGVDRTEDSTRLGGVRYTGNASQIEESIVGASHRLARENGAVPDVALVSFQTHRRLVNELGSKVQRGEGPGAKGGLMDIQVYGVRGLVDCVPCTFCQNDVIWLLTSSSWQLVSMGEPVSIIDEDGQMVLRVSDADANEVRVGSYAQLACSAPGANCRISL